MLSLLTFRLTSLLLFLFSLLWFRVCVADLDCSITVQNIANIDLQAGTFDADFLVAFRDSKDGSAYSGRFEIVNSARFVRIDNNTLPSPYFRVMSTFYFTFTAAQYPFDAHSLSFSIFVPDTTVHVILEQSTVASTIRLPGWVIDEPPVAITEDKAYLGPALGNQQVSTLFIRVKRPALKSFVVCFLPPIFVLLTLFLSFSIPAKEALARLGTSSGALVSMVMSHANVPIPPTQFLTLMDKFFCISYFVLVGANIMGIVILALNSKYGSDSPLVTRVNRIFELGIWVTSPVLYCLLLVPWPYLFLLIFIPIILIFGPRLLARKMTQTLRDVRRRRELEKEQGDVFVDHEDQNTKLTESKSMFFQDLPSAYPPASSATASSNSGVQEDPSLEGIVVLDDPCETPAVPVCRNIPLMSNTPRLGLLSPCPRVASLASRKTSGTPKMAGTPSAMIPSPSMDNCDTEPFLPDPHDRSDYVMCPVLKKDN